MNSSRICFMAKGFLEGWMLPAVLAGLLVGGGCNDSDTGAPAQPPPPSGPGGPGGPMGGGPGGAGPRSPIGEIMAKLGSPRGSMTQQLGQELNEASPPWETIQGQAR